MQYARDRSKKKRKSTRPREDGRSDAEVRSVPSVAPATLVAL
jgi:hypothetical protein